MGTSGAVCKSRLQSSIAITGLLYTVSPSGHANPGTRGFLRAAFTIGDAPTSQTKENAE